MKKMATVAIALCMAISGYAQAVAPDSEGMNLSAQEWTRNVVMGWNLGNSLECPNNETEWGNPKTTKAMIHAVAESGFNAIRIPVRWGNHVTNASTMAIDPNWLARVKEVVDWCLEENMYVVINSHHEEWYDRNPYYNKQAENNAKISAMWTSIATYFRDYDERLIFAGTNEITDRNLVVQTFACSPYHGLSGFTIPQDKVEGRLSVEFHYYDPYEYCGNCTYYYWGNAYKDMGRIPANSTEQTITSLFDRITNTWMKKGLGVVMGEYGVSNHYTENDKQTQQENMQYYLKCVVSEARTHGFAAFAWDNNAFGNGPENFGIFRRWQNMTVGNTYFLRGITEGAGAEYKEPDPREDDNPGEGETLWEGDALLDWGNGLQLTIPGSLFEGKGEQVQLVLSYTQEYTDYDDIQIFYGDWSSMVAYTVGGNSFTGDFIPSNAYATGSGTSHVTAFSFAPEVLRIIYQKGIVIQGHGIRLNKVSLTDPTGIATITTDSNLRHRSGIYTIDGRRVSQPQPGHLYIKDGKKFVK